MNTKNKHDLDKKYGAMTFSRFLKHLDYLRIFLKQVLPKNPLFW